MSAEATGWVFRHSPFKGATFSVHLAIADSVNDQHENEFWMAQANLATKSRLADRATRDAVLALAEGGYIEPCDSEMLDPAARARAGRPTRWRFLFPEVEVVYETRRRPRHDVPTPDATPAADAGVPRQDVPPSPAADADVTQEEPKVPSQGSRSSVASETSRASGVTSARRPRARSARDDIWDALVEVYGQPSAGQRAFVGKTITALMAAPDCTADEVRRRGRLARAHWPGSSMAALDKHWGALATMPPPAAPRRVRAEDSETRTMRDPSQTGEVTSL